MKGKLLNKEIIMLLIPILISAAVNSYSNWYNFKEKEKEKEFIYNSATNLVDENFNLELKNDFHEDKIKVFKLITQRKSKILKTYNQLLENNKIEISQDKVMKGFAIEISKNIGEIEAYRNIYEQDSIARNTFVSYLMSEREFIESIRKNNITDATLYNYYQTEFRLLKEDELDKKNIANNLKRSKIKERKIFYDTNNFSVVANLNYLLFLITICGTLFLIYYSVKFKVFK